MNPDYDYGFYDDEQAFELISKNYGPEYLRCYEALPPGAFRADLWRYCALYLYGGVYADVDTLCCCPLSNLIREEDEFIVSRGDHPAFLFNAFICAIPKSVILEKLLNQIIGRFRSNEWGDPFMEVGPGGLRRALNVLLGRDHNTRYALGRNEINGIRFRILEKLDPGEETGRVVMNGDTKILFCKYDGYREDLEQADVEHWAKDRAAGTIDWNA